MSRVSKNKKKKTFLSDKRHIYVYMIRAFTYKLSKFKIKWNGKNEQ